MLRKLCCFVAAAFLVAACGDKSSTSAFSPDKPSAIVSAVATAIQTAGNSMVTARLAPRKSANLFDLAPRIAPTVCDEHGYPAGLSESQSNYPGYLTYCFVTKDAGDTVLGGFSLAKQIGCAVEAAGIVFDGVERTVTLNTVGCFTDSTEAPASFSAKVTGSAPASYNSNYAKGVIIDAMLPAGGRPDSHLVFKMASNVTGSTISFITTELWDDLSTGAHAGTFDTSAGKIWYEAREQRADCVTSGRCGWNRHTRMAASVAMSGTTVTGLTGLSFAYSNIQKPPGQSSYGGTLITSSGDLTSGIKPRLFQATHNGSGQPSAMADYQTAANWVEVANTACYTNTSETATTCGTGLAKFSTNGKFALAGDQQDLTTWFTTRTAQNFTSVDVDSDVQ